MRKMSQSLLPITRSLGMTSACGQLRPWDLLSKSLTQPVLGEPVLTALQAPTGSDDALFRKVARIGRIPTQQLPVRVPDATLQIGHIGHPRLPECQATGLWDHAMTLHPRQTIPTHRLTPARRRPDLRRVATLCLALCTGTAWANEGHLEPPGGAGHDPAVTHPQEHIPVPAPHPSAPRDPLHPEGGLPGHGSEHDPLHPEPEDPNKPHPLEPVRPKNTGNDSAPHGNDPGTRPGGSPGSSRKLPAVNDSSVRYETAMKAAQDWQNLLRGVDGAGTVWETLRRSYNRVMGNPRLPAGFGRASYLPEHLQDLLHASNGNYEAALRTNLGDLDRELLRATFDKDYYREPLMGYKSYDKFVQRHGSAAPYQDIQTLSPVDRLQYLMTFGRQAKAERNAALQLGQDLRALQAHDSQMADLENARQRAQAQTRVAGFMFEQIVNRQKDEGRRRIDGGDDDDFELDPDPQPGTGGGSTPGRSRPDPAPAPDPAADPSTPPVSPSPQHQGTLDAITRHRIVWEASRRTNPGLFKRLGSAYVRAVGSAKLPDTFNDPGSLPDHLQTLLSQNGGYESVMRLNIGDLDREVLRATFDPAYYKEPLMGYASYTQFLARYGDRATILQVQMLSPPDRLQYLAHYSKQSAEEYAAVQRRMQDYQRAQQANARQAQLEQLRDEVRRIEAVNAVMLDNLMRQNLESTRRMLEELDDDDI